jgi:AcrR family transcriptional regulator
MNSLSIHISVDIRIILVEFQISTDILNVMTDTSPPRITREQRQRQTRQQLLNAGRRLIVEKGFGGASLRDIAQAAGYSQGAFYSNFDSKEALLLELLREHMALETDQLAEIFSHEDDSIAALMAGLEQWAATLDHNPDWSVLAVELLLHTQRSPAFAQAYQLVWAEHRARIAGFITLLFERYERPAPQPAEALATSFMALAHGLALHRVNSLPVAAGQMILTFLRALLTAPL